MWRSSSCVTEVAPGQWKPEQDICPCSLGKKPFCLLSFGETLTAVESRSKTFRAGKSLAKTFGCWMQFFGLALYPRSLVSDQVDRSHSESAVCGVWERMSHSELPEECYLCRTPPGPHPRSITCSQHTSALYGSIVHACQSLTALLDKKQKGIYLMRS